jgi:hypothetical protein
MKIEQVSDILSKINGTTFASLDTVTNVTLKGGKANSMLGRVTKVTANNQVMIFTNKNSNGYENMVKRRLEAEGKDPESFKLGELPWGKRIPNTPLIEHNDVTYIQVIFNKPGKSTYFLDGDPIDKDSIEGFQEKPETNKQGLEHDNQVIPRTFKLDSIQSIRILGEEIKA